MRRLLPLALALELQNNDDDDDTNVTSNSNDKKYTEAFFQQWLDQNSAKIQTKLPALLDASLTKFFVASCQHVDDALKAKQEATAERTEIQKHKPVDQDALDKANQAVKDAEAALEAAQKDALLQALPLLDSLETTNNGVDKDTRQLLLVTDVLVQATPKGLADYCANEAASSDHDHAKALVQLLTDKRQFPLLQDMVLAGGARNGQYGPALELYNELHDSKKDPLLQRLALAVALELADPLTEFGYTANDKRYVNPIHRYRHYEQAWMFGELDPVFATFSVWELRMVINSDAPDDQLGWGRQMLMNYRPDLMELNDKWRYCRIVRTDVSYGHPHWDPDRPMDFPQILSGGGECGPRAWMGRFICKAFGIPTWGVREPGHAAMARWTADQGWVVCLGAAMPFAWWEKQCGLYFQLETEARKTCSTDATKSNQAYGEKVMTLEWIADMLGEPLHQVCRSCLADPKAMWRSLSLMQRRRLSQNKNTKPPQKEERGNVVPRLERLRISNATTVEATAMMDNGTILIPAANCDKAKQNKNVMIMDSFLGGKQLWLDQDGSVEYTLSAPPGGKYELSCQFVTVHDGKVTPQPPLQVTIDGGETSSVSGDNGWEVVQGNLWSCYSIPLPYTKGMWDETKPVTIDLPSNVTSCKISLSRDAAARGMVLKVIKLVPTFHPAKQRMVSDDFQIPLQKGLG